MRTLCLQRSDAETLTTFAGIGVHVGPETLTTMSRNMHFPLYQQFLHLGEAGLAMSMYIVVVSRNLAPEADKNNWGARKAMEIFESRLRLVTRQLDRAPYMAGETFTAADISVTYALEFASRTVCYPFGEAERAYIARTIARDSYKRAMDACSDTKAWAASVAAMRAAES